MKNLIPLMALLVVGGSFVAPAAMAGGSGKCTDGEGDCCKDGAKKGAKKVKSTVKASKGDADTKPAAK